MLFSNLVALLAILVTGYLQYAKMDRASRRRLGRLLSTVRDSATSTSKRIGAIFLKLIALAFCVLVTGISVLAILAFAEADGPIARIELLKLLMNMMLAAFYSIGSVACVVMLIPRRPASATGE